LFSSSEGVPKGPKHPFIYYTKGNSTKKTFKNLSSQLAHHVIQYT
jgi:hypothetical protein